MNEKWNLIIEPPGAGRRNMAVDRALLTACGEGRIAPTVRLYGWSVPTVSIGYSQNPDADLDLVRCREMGVPIVRRPTGGRALLHHKELTYSIAAPIPHPNFPANLRGAYQVISQALIHFLVELGIGDAAIAEPGSRERKLRAARSPCCFSSINHCEITVGEKKLIGSAQRRTKKAFLQHGSVWLDCDRAFMNSLFRYPSEEARKANLEILERVTSTLNEICGKEVGFERTAQAFAAGFKRSFAGVEWVRMTAGELESICSFPPVDIK